MPFSQPLHSCCFIVLNISIKVKYKIIQEGRKILHFLFAAESYTETKKEVHHDGE